MNSLGQRLNRNGEWPTKYSGTLKFNFESARDLLLTLFGQMVTLKSHPRMTE